MMAQSPNWSESRRRLTAMSTLDWVAVFCIGASLIFWGVIYFSLLAPPLPRIAPQTFVARDLTTVSTLIIPHFWSIPLPPTPAGQPLQKTQWQTIGFWIILGAALHMTWYANTWIRLWRSSQPAIRDNSLDGTGTIVCL